MSINKLEILFHIIIINFVIALSITANNYNYLLTVIDKFSKRVLTIPEKITYDAAK